MDQEDDGKQDDAEASEEEYVPAEVGVAAPEEDEEDEEEEQESVEPV